MPFLNFLLRYGSLAIFISFSGCPQRSGREVSQRLFLKRSLSANAWPCRIQIGLECLAFGSSPQLSFHFSLLLYELELKMQKQWATFQIKQNIIRFFVQLPLKKASKPYRNQHFWPYLVVLTYVYRTEVGEDDP